MDKQLKLQLDVKNNAQDLQNYMLDLKNWEEEMKRKDLTLNNENPPENRIPPPRNKIKRNKLGNEKNSNKPKKISAYDYSAWDKFDVDKACAEIDENDSSERLSEDEPEETSNSRVKDDDSFSDSKNFSLIDEAFYEKEMGNSFVKKEQWNDAIKCYTNAINLDSNNAIYYANRSLCFLKLQNFKAAETDATAAIQLDKNYVKAYQRRAFARQALGQLIEAKADYEEILKLEPKNALSRLEINKIDDKLKSQFKTKKPSEKKIFNPKNMFKTQEDNIQNKQSDNKSTKQQTVQTIPVQTLVPKNQSVTTNLSSTLSASKFKTEDAVGIINNKKNVTSGKKYSTIETGGDGDKVVPSQSVKPRSDIFKPLPEWCKIMHPVNMPPHKRSKKPLKKMVIIHVDKDEDFSIIDAPKNECSNICIKEEESEKRVNLVVKNTNVGKGVNIEHMSFEVPKTAIQFQKSWKILKQNPTETYNYLKKIPGNELPQIFENSLESDFFSELITFLALDNVEKEPDIIYNFLLGLSSVKRFSSLTLFMSEFDRKCVKKCLMELEKVKSREEILELHRLYELKG